MYVLCMCVLCVGSRLGWREAWWLMGRLDGVNLMGDIQASVEGLIGGLKGRACREELMDGRT